MLVHILGKADTKTGLNKAEFIGGNGYEGK